jgi:hypothetical protein
MIVSISLDQPHTHYTNLDVINGKVILKAPNPVTISSIVVKLEGEARTRLLSAVRPDRPERQRPVLEVHKVRLSVSTGVNHNVQSNARSRFSTKHK